MTDIEIQTKLKSHKIAANLIEMAELEQQRAEEAYNKATVAANLALQVHLLAEKDKHVARSHAFIEAARSALAS